MFSELRVFFFQNSDFFKNLSFFFKSQFFIVLNNEHVIYLLTTIAGSKKMNKMVLMIKNMVFSVFCFILHLSLGTSIMLLYIPVTSGNCDPNSSIECYFNLD